MSLSGDAMELTEAEITAHYDAALALLEGFDHAPRLGKPVERAAAERSPGIGTRGRCGSTQPGLATRGLAAIWPRTPGSSARPYVQDPACVPP